MYWCSLYDVGYDTYRHWGHGHAHDIFNCKSIFLVCVESLGLWTPFFEWLSKPEMTTISQESLTQQGELGGLPQSGIDPVADLSHLDMSDCNDLQGAASDIEIPYSVLDSVATSARWVLRQSMPYAQHTILPRLKLTWSLGACTTLGLLVLQRKASPYRSPLGS